MKGTENLLSDSAGQGTWVNVVNVLSYLFEINFLFSEYG